MEKKSEFGFVFVYGGNDRYGNRWVKYRTLAKTPEELYDAMQTWHSYGNQKDVVITPSEMFKHKVNIVFGIDKPDGYVLGELKTTGCGAWGISFYRALAPTLEAHEAIYKETLTREREERKRKSEEAKQKLMEEYYRLRRGWYLVTIEVQGLTRNAAKPKYFDASCCIIADSKMDAYNKATREEDLINQCAESGLTYSGYYSEWNSTHTEIEFLGMKVDDGYSIEAWEEFSKTEEYKNSLKK